MPRRLLFSPVPAPGPLTGVFGRSRSLILLHVIACAAARRNPSIRELVRLIGATSPNAARFHLLALRKAGLVTWEAGTKASHLGRTIRPTCRFVPAATLNG